MAHASTSLSYAVLYKKAIIFLYFKQYLQIYVGQDILNYSNFFNKDVIFLDNINTYTCDLSMDTLAYKNYKEMYIKDNETRNQLYWVSVSERLNKEFIKC